MKALTIPVIGAALFLAACGGAATLSGSTAKPGGVDSSIRLSAGVNAGSDASNVDVNRVNPVIHKGSSNLPIRPVQSQNVAPAAPAAAAAPVTHIDRCSTGAGSNSNSSGKHLPLPMCAPQ